MGSDGANLDLSVQFSIAHSQLPVVLLAGDIKLAGGFQAIQNIREISFTGFTRETNNVTIGGWWLALGK